VSRISAEERNVPQSDEPPTSPEESSHPPGEGEEVPLTAFLGTILDELPVAVFVKEAKERRFVQINKSFAAFYDRDPAQLLGKSNDHLLSVEDAAYLREKDLLVLEKGEVLDIPEEILDLPGRGTRILHTRKVPLSDAQGRRSFLLGITEDITERKRAEEAIRKERELLEDQKRLLGVIRELSTPVLPVFEGILVMPLVGQMDQDRSAQFLEALLAGIQQHRAEMVLLDITGVSMMDAQVAGHLIQATRAAALLSTTCILVGASPEVARTLVALGVDLSELVTQRDLQAGVLYALSQQGKAVVKRRSG